MPGDLGPSRSLGHLHRRLGNLRHCIVGEFPVPAGTPATVIDVKRVPIKTPKPYFVGLFKADHHCHLYLLKIVHCNAPSIDQSQRNSFYRDRAPHSVPAVNFIHSMLLAWVKVTCYKSPIKRRVITESVYQSRRYISGLVSSSHYPKPRYLQQYRLEYRIAYIARPTGKYILCQPTCQRLGGPARGQEAGRTEHE